MYKDMTLHVCEGQKLWDFLLTDEEIHYKHCKDNFTYIELFLSSNKCKIQSIKR